MRWHKRQRQTPATTAASRRGFLLLEAAVALALLAAAATAVASLAAGLARERHTQLQRAAVRLEAENIAERLQMADYRDLPRLAEQLSSTGRPAEAAAGTGAPSSIESRVRLEPFTAQNVEGRHVTITVTATRQAAGRLQAAELELWRFDGHPAAAPDDVADRSAAEQNQ